MYGGLNCRPRYSPHYTACSTTYGRTKNGGFGTLRRRKGKAICLALSHSCGNGWPSRPEGLGGRKKTIDKYQRTVSTAATPSAAGRAREVLTAQVDAPVNNPSTSKSMRRKTEIVSFRADASLLARIDKSREALEISRGEWVREVVIAHFHNLDDSVEWPAQIADFRQSQDQLQQEVNRLHTNQRRSLLIVLTRIGELDLESAKELVRCKLQS